MSFFFVKNRNLEKTCFKKVEVNVVIFVFWVYPRALELVTRQ